MNKRQVLIVGGIVGLLVSSAVLALLWFSVAGVLVIGRTDLMYVFWPSSLMLTSDWRNTVVGVATTLVSVGINCLLYMAVAYGLYSVARTFGRSARC